MLTRLWILLFFLIFMCWNEIHKALKVYQEDNNKNKLILRAVLITLLGIFIFNGAYYVASTELETLESQTYHVKKVLGAARKGHKFKSLSKRLIRERKSAAVKDAGDSD